MRKKRAQTTRASLAIKQNRKVSGERCAPFPSLKGMARVTGLEPATSGVTGRHSNQLSYTRVSSARRRKAG